MKELVYDEVLPILHGSEKELQSFAHKILERFRNPYIRHLWQSIALNAMSKWETRNLPSMLNYYDANGMLPQKQVFSLAAMIAYFKGEAPGSLRPLRTVRATFTAYGSGTFKALPVKGNPAVITFFIRHKSSNLFALFC
jgi:mannitol-1-phosphate/altronate dehydrogenase